MEAIINCWSKEGHHFVMTDRYVYELTPDPYGVVPFIIGIVRVTEEEDFNASHS